MLISWIVLAIVQLSAAGLPVIDLPSGPPHLTTHSIAPGEPSTLFEAVFGVTIIAAYLMLVRRVRPRRRRTTVSKPTGRGTKRKAA